MRDHLKEAIQKVRADRQAARRYLAVMVVLALLTTLSVSWRLHQVGTAMTTDDEYTCGYEAHIHTDECYTEVLICGYEEGEPEQIDAAFGVDMEEPDAEEDIEPEPEEPKFEVHHHTDECYREVTELTCDTEEHLHEEYCYDTETGDLLCTQEEHVHDDSCYTTEEELICGYEEGEEIPVEDDFTEFDTYDAVQDSTPVVFDDDWNPEDLVVSVPVHHHTEECYEKVLTCPLPEHEHTLECLADITADIETEDDWEKQSEDLSGFWNDGLVEIAQKQLGYTESVKNFEVDFDGVETHHYTRYGAWYGNPYGDWAVMFVSFCQHYAGIPKDVIPQRAGLFALRTDLEAINPDLLAEGGEQAVPGDIVTYYNSEGEETIGIVTEENDAFLTVISGAVNGAVAEVAVNRNDITNTILVDKAYAAYMGLDDDQPDDDAGDTVDDGAGDDMDADMDDIADDAAEDDKDTDADDTASDIADDDADEIEVDEVLSFDVDAVLEQEGAVAYVLRKAPAQFATYAAVRTEPKYNADNSLILDDFLKEAEIKLGKKENGVLTWFPLEGTEIDDNASVSVEMKYAVPTGVFKNKKATYTLPKGIYPTKDMTGNVTDAKGEKILGTYKLTKGSPTVEFTFEDTSSGFDGTFMFATEVSYDETENGGTINLGDQTYTIKPEYSLDAEKSGTLSEDGQTISYEVTVTAPYGTNGETVTITDAFDWDKSTAKGSYKEESLLVNGKPLSYYSDASINYEPDGSGFTITGLPALTYNDPTYTLTYDVAVQQDSIHGADGSGTLVNRATAKSGKLNDTDAEEVTVKESSLEKKGVYDPATNRITWTITVKNPGVDLDGYKVTDTQVTKLDIVGDVVLKDSTGTQITTISGSNFLNDGYTFPKGSNSESYTFTYVTEAPELVNNKIYAENQVTLKKDSFIYTATGVVSEKAGWNVEKQFSAITPIGDGNQKMTWKITGTVPGGAKNFQIVDNIWDKTYGDGYGNLYGVKSELEAAIKENLRLAMENGTTLTWSQAEAEGIKMTLTFYSNNSNDKQYSNNDVANKVEGDEQEVHRFRLEFVRENGARLGILSFELPEIPTVAKATDMKANETDRFRNRADLFSDEKWKQGYFAFHDYKKPGSIEKKSSPDNKNYKTDPNSTSYSKHKIIYYEITLRLDEISYEKQTIVDEIPEGMKLATDQASLDTFRVGMDLDTKPGNKYTGATEFGANVYGIKKDGYTYYTIDNSVPGQLTFTVFADGPNPPKKLFDDGKDSSKQHTIEIRYALEIDDEAWSDRNRTEKEYTNTATWGEVKDSAIMKVLRPKQETLTKTGAYDATKHQANYTIIVNPGAEKLSSNGELELKDTMSSEYFGKNGMELMLDSVKVYDYLLRDGEWVKGGEVIGGCRIETGEQTESTREYTFVLPDERALVLEYSYKMNTNGLAQDLFITNTAFLTGGYSNTYPVKVSYDQSSATINNAVLTVFKTDAAGNMPIKTSSATFQVEHYNRNTGAWELFRTETTLKTTGSFDLTFANGGSDQGLLEMGDLYRLVETTAPDGYKLDATPHYFIWSSTATDETTKQNALSAATGSNAPEGVRVDTVNFFGGGDNKLGTWAISNEQSVLTLRKVWNDLYNANMDAPVESIQVRLWRYPENGDKKTQSTVVQDITLTKDGSWTTTVPLDAGYRYYVKELGTDEGELAFFEVNYSPENDAGVAGGGTITITNKQCPSYELPSTGSTGTTWYTAGGALMMGIALVCGYFNKRRHGRRSE